MYEVYYKIFEEFLLGLKTEYQRDSEFWNFLFQKKKNFYLIFWVLKIKKKKNFQKAFVLLVYKNFQAPWMFNVYTYVNYHQCYF